MSVTALAPAPSVPSTFLFANAPTTVPARLTASPVMTLVSPEALEPAATVAKAPAPLKLATVVPS